MADILILTTGGTIDKGAPAAFLSQRQQAALTGPDGKFRVSLYKALLYIEVAAALKSGMFEASGLECQVTEEQFCPVPKK